MAQHDPYFETMIERQPLICAAAVRRQLERWEPLVALHTLTDFQKNQKPAPEHPVSIGLLEIWEGESEHPLPPGGCRPATQGTRHARQPSDHRRDVASELRESRDLNEHWEDNMPVFNVGPSRPKAPPRPSGKRFATRNPRHGPYCWWAWDGNRGPLVTPNVTATQVNELVEVVIAACNAARPDDPIEIPDATPRPWYIPTKKGEWWWPKLEAVFE